MHPFVASTLGGLIIGLASALLLLSQGRIAGISGISASAAFGPREGWRLAFVAGLGVGGLVLLQSMPTAFAVPVDRSLFVLAAAGLLVGFGTQLGRGCTSGHGVCGLGRLSRRSALATGAFMLTGFATASLLHLMGGAR